MNTCGSRGTCVDGVNSYSCDYDGIQETDIDADQVCENPDDCGARLIVRAMEKDVSENPMRAVNAERLVFERTCWRRW